MLSNEDKVLSYLMNHPKADPGDLEFKDRTDQKLYKGILASFRVFAKIDETAIAVKVWRTERQMVAGVVRIVHLRKANVTEEEFFAAFKGMAADQAPPPTPRPGTPPPGVPSTEEVKTSRKPSAEARRAKSRK